MFAGFSARLSAQTAFEADAGAGYSFVDQTAWVGITPNSWSQTSGAGDIEALLLHAGPAAFGAEAGYQYFFSYEIPNGYGGYRGVDVSAWHVSALARLGLGLGFFTEAGVGAQFFSAGTDLSVTGDLGYTIPLGKKLAVPVKVRVDAVLDSDTTLVPLVLTVGLMYTL